ncbi:MAG: AAA family ATPase [Pseudomonadota bacterium]|nr:AAA family ATPase [Pseudomonadota bacterium]
MYTNFFGLNEKPFSITPNPRYLYMSERHTEALAHLIYGVTESNGFIQLTGEVGTGKTTLIRGLLQQLPNNVEVALILNPQLNAIEFLGAIHQELNIKLPDEKSSLQTLTASIYNYLLENYSDGKRTLLILDEAQNFSFEVLEQIRLLTNLETVRQKLLQITLIGQPELRTMLAKQELRQLAQRITARYHLEPLSQKETYEYVQHRLKVAGSSTSIIDKASCRELSRLSGGIPRIINVIADRALLGAFSSEQNKIKPKLIRQAGIEVYGKINNEGLKKKEWLKITGFFVTAMTLIGITFLSSDFILNKNSFKSKNTSDINQSEYSNKLLPITNEESGVILNKIQFENLLKNKILETTKNAAFKNLFSLWDIEYKPTKRKACEYALEKNLSCFFHRGSFNQIEKLNRPAILTLQDNDGEIHQVVLAEINNFEAKLLINENLIEVTLEAISKMWFGEFLLLWKPQISEIKSFSPGMLDEDIAWVRESLKKILGASKTVENLEYFDGELGKQVRQYQIVNQLSANGLIDQQTQININTDIGITGPRLKKVK